jgi:hypothetical protein
MLWREEASNLPRRARRNEEREDYGLTTFRIERFFVRYEEEKSVFCEWTRKA